MTPHVIRRPSTKRLGLGVGMDLPWGEPIGFVRDRERGDSITSKVRQFLTRYQDRFHYLVFAFQPCNRNRLRAEDYFDAYDSLFDVARQIPVRAFHHTLLNMARLSPSDSGDIVRFTNALVERYQFAWIVEDLGLWSLMGKSLPYPLPPYLTPEGLAACIRNVRDFQSRLAAPLCVEFPGFTDGAVVTIGSMDAFDFFRIVAEETGSPVTIDIGHILSYQWLRGHMNERRFEGLDKLPLEACHEIHLSGCQISNGRFRDLHHGILLDEQLDLLEYLLPRCPNARAITYEDPQYHDDGVLVPKSIRNFERLATMTSAWFAGESHD